MGRLTGKVAIVTGAATGLGRAIAQVYAEEGAKVVVSDIRADEAEATARSIREDGGEAIAVRTDVSRSADVQELVATAERELGALHIMTANAGILGRGSGKSLVDMSDEEFAEIMDVNCGGVVLCFKHSIPAIRRAGGGAMTATASLAAHRGYADLPAYCTSKAAVTGLVRSLAADLAPEIRVNAVAAGSMQTELGVHTAELKGIDPAELVTRRRGQAGAGARDDAFARVAHPREVALAHLFLASDEASFITGQSLLVDNGRSILPM
jgi:NAD(P)-dependent dehydrogenase (short-subunit alcohol dehydrogenase family)